MRVAFPTLVLVCALATGPGGASAQEITLESAPAVVVKAIPEAGTGDVDPARAEIEVTFSKEMRDGTWSWSSPGPGMTPEITGEPRYRDDKRTCVLPVKLQPGRTYALWINSQRHRNFKDAAGQPSLPYLLVFKTKG